jgi:hypothetical protein
VVQAHGDVVSWALAVSAPNLIVYEKTLLPKMLRRALGRQGESGRIPFE